MWIGTDRSVTPEIVTFWEEPQIGVEVPILTALELESSYVWQQQLSLLDHLIEQAVGCEDLKLQLGLPSARRMRRDLG